jgi:hypothetical protein
MARKIWLTAGVNAAAKRHHLPAFSVWQSDYSALARRRGDGQAGQRRR